MLDTPFGKIRILADGKPIEYHAEPHDFDMLMNRERPLAGCYRIHLSGEGRKEICCVLESGGFCGMDSSGEGYQAVEFVKGNQILTIGTETDHPAFSAIPRPDGIAVSLHGLVQQVVFGVAWAEDYHGDSDVRTWFASDPTLDQ